MAERDKPERASSENPKDSDDAATLTAGRTLSAAPVHTELGPGVRPTDFSLPAGANLGDYHILRPLGKGGMGEVYEAGHIPSGRRVALKVLSQALRTAEDRERFLQEGKLAAQVNHPNCVYVYGAEEIQGRPAISMELVPGGTLKDMLKEKGSLPPEKAVDLTIQVVKGLEAMQSAGVLHRDIKPSNAFVDAEGNAKIGDFGLSISTLARAEGDAFASGTFAGTPAFASPEQILGEELDVRSDIYSVGATLYCLLTGRPPFDEADLRKLVARILETTPDSPRNIRESVPRGLAEVVMRCLEKPRSARFSDYRGLRRALRPFGSAAMKPADPAVRVSAAILDLAVLAGLLLLAGSALHALRPFKSGIIFYLGGLLFLLYFTVLEGLAGTTAGKAVRKIRVVGPEKDTPGILRSLLRSVIFFTVVIVLGRLAEVRLAGLLSAVNAQGTETLIAYLAYPTLAGLLFVTARRRNGFAGIGDLASRTRVVVAPPAEDKSVERVPEPVALPAGKRTIGPYTVVEGLRADPGDELLLGYDERLKRRLWIRVRPPGAAPLPESRRDISRPGRLRWINGMRSSETSWDAYEAPRGAPFLGSVARRHSWILVRAWLRELVEEIMVGLDERSLPSLFGLDRIWVSVNGRLKILDFTAPGLDAKLELSEPARTTGDPESLKELRGVLKQVALVALEGVRPGIDDARRGVPGIPLPLQARKFVALMGGEEGPGLGEVSGRIKAWIDRPDDTSKFRLKRLTSVALCLSFVAWVDLLGLLPRAESWRSLATWSIALGYLGILASVSAIVNRGGFVLNALNIAVVRSDGSPVSRTRAFLRSFIAWSPMIFLGLLPSLWNGSWILDPLAAEKVGGLAFPLWPSMGLVAVSLAGAVWSVITPERGPQDRIAATCLVPK